LLCAGAAPATTPARPPTTAPKAGMLRASADLLAKWHDRFDHEKLSYLVAPPFVLAGDTSPIKLHEYLQRTVQPSADAMHKQFFKTAPDRPILILLFESDESYRRLARKWFGDTNLSPYGYFRGDNVMVMNVSTGTGTLVHKLTHALIRPDFPDVPDWFNEGLGSLFEQCTLERGRIRGLTNWRLAALQRAIQDKELRPLKQLIEDRNFYAEPHVGLNYAQARYLLMYLQENNKLELFYRQLRAAGADDPTGLKTLTKIIEPQPLEEFDQFWRKWVMGLRFP
jgi:hypothetical protein